MLTPVSQSPIDKWIDIITNVVREEMSKKCTQDNSHDFGHFYRVSSLARQFARAEKGNELIAFTSGMLHDIITLPKNDPNAEKSSLFAAKRAKELLLNLSFPQELILNVCHSIHAHSFSAKIEPKTIEARCVQDADRMEALGAFGLMRVFYCSGMFGSQLLDENDPAGEYRALDDKKFALDHFVQKLLTLYDTMKTSIGRKMAFSLSKFLEEYRNKLINDQKVGNLSTDCFIIAKIYHNAGENNLALFHPDDPFAKGKRKLNPSKYTLDNLLNKDTPYINKFLSQLKFELNGYSHLILN